MGDLFIASTQYNDLTGGAAFDGHDGPPLFELAKCSNMPSEGYWPVGFELFRLDPDEQTGKIPFTLVAVSCDEAGSKIDQIIEFAKTAEELRVYRFEGHLDPREFPVLFKRVDIKVIRKGLRNANVVAYFPPER